MKVDLYENYTSTSVLHNVKEEDLTKSSSIYFKKNILKHIGNNKDVQILEIGCGYGRYTKTMLDLGYKNIKGIDISSEQIAYAKGKLGLKNVEIADALDYLNKDIKYDVIFLMDVLEHLELEYAILLLKQVYQSLNPGGRFVIHVPNGMAPLSPPFYGDITHVRAFSVDSMSQILRMAGFSEFNHYALPPLVVGIKSWIRRVLWLLIINPSIKIFLKIANGSTSGGIYTSNLLTITKR